MTLPENILQTYPYIIWDFDGVIFTLDWNYGESLADYRERIRKVVAEFDATFAANYNPEERISHVVNEVVKQYGETAKQKFYELIKARELELIPSARPNPEAIAYIRNHPDKKFFIWSNNFLETISILLKQAGIQEQIAGIASKDAIELAKPYPDGFKLIHITETKPDQYLLIGDQESDRVAAETAGISFLKYQHEL